MKKKILSIFIFCVCIFSLYGCDDIVNNNTNNKPNNKFVNTGDVYYFDDSNPAYIYYDRDTKIVYMIGNANGGGYCPYLDSNGKPMTIDQYNKMKSE